MAAEYEIVERLNWLADEALKDASEHGDNATHAARFYRESAATIVALAEALEHSKNQLLLEWDYWSQLDDGTNVRAHKRSKAIGRAVDKINTAQARLKGDSA